ncbi:hypothetical protein [Streptomyces acidiscabies]|uniref:hypothetical protein n=1 Tax=Streptomyces acidiscabies TaxID=42234 RepID=UPI00095E0781|nr:hypothetical protein [Streptomyces acidiscabies]GAV45686.1 hypothetical protein Saa2_08678 [Streptomyces acidiscabies]
MTCTNPQCDGGIIPNPHAAGELSFCPDCTHGSAYDDIDCDNDPVPSTGNAS